MTNLEKIQFLVKISKLIELLDEEEAINGLVLVRNSLKESWGLELNNGSTTPKKLFGKTYSEMAKKEVAEYSQIKRLIRRYLTNE